MLTDFMPTDFMPIDFMPTDFMPIDFMPTEITDLLTQALADSLTPYLYKDVIHIISTYLELQLLCCRQMMPRGSCCRGFDAPFRALSFFPGTIAAVHLHCHSISACSKKGRQKWLPSLWLSGYNVQDAVVLPDNKQVAVLSQYPAQVKIWNRYGHLITSWEKGPDHAGRITFLTLASGAEAFAITDPLENQVGIYTKDGKKVCCWGRWGSQDGEFNNLQGITFLPSTREVVVADQGNSRIQFFSVEGKFVRQWKFNDHYDEDKAPMNVIPLYGNNGLVISNQVSISVFTLEKKLLCYWTGYWEKTAEKLVHHKFLDLGKIDMVSESKIVLANNQGFHQLKILRIQPM